MITLLLIGILTAPCVAVNPTDSSIEFDDNELGSMADPIDRWIDLHNQIYDDSSLKKTSLFITKMLIDEMNSIEQSEDFNFAMVNQWLELYTRRYGHLLAKAYKMNVIDKSNSTITNLIYRVINYESNACKVEYFELLNQLYLTFRQAPIEGVLRDSRRLQYQNCWQRLMSSLVNTSLLLGNSVRDPLDELVASIYPNSKDIVDLNGSDLRNESQRIAENIAAFLTDYRSKYETKDIMRLFEVIIHHGCRLLINKTRQNMNDIHELLSFVNHDKRDFVSHDDINIINRYIMCDRIIDNLDFISSFVRRFYENYIQNENCISELCIPNNIHNELIEIMDESDDEYDNDPDDADFMNEQRHDGQSIINHLSKQWDQFNANLGTEHITTTTTNQPENRYNLNEEEANLITQHIPIDNSKTIPISILEFDNPNIETLSVAQPMPGPERVVRILRSIGAGRYALYPTIWSNGFMTMQKKEYLLEKWPEIWQQYFQERKARYQKRYLARRSSKPEPTLQIDAEFGYPNPPPAEPRYFKKQKQMPVEERELSPTDEVMSRIGIVPGPLQVLAIGRPTGRARHTKYPTYWSDGTKTFEKKDYLQSHWKEAWTVLTRRLRASRQRKWLEKQKKKKDQ